MSQTFIKICGLTTREDVETCLTLGVKWLGFNCFPKSKRYISPEKIRKLLSIIPPEVITVGVFVNESIKEVNQVMEYTGIQLVQLHGDESPEYTQSLNNKYIRAFRVSPQFQLEMIMKYQVTHFLLDTYHPNFYGGTGASFNWEIAKKAKTLGNVILAGGLTPDNVKEAIMTVRPFGVDVCSGVEVSPGVKDLKLVEAFISTVQNTDQMVNAS